MLQIERPLIVIVCHLLAQTVAGLSDSSMTTLRLVWKSQCCAIFELSQNSLQTYSRQPRSCTGVYYFAVKIFFGTVVKLKSVKLSVS